MLNSRAATDQKNSLYAAILFTVLGVMFPLSEAIASRPRPLKNIQIDWSVQQISESVMPSQKITREIGFSLTPPKRFPVKYDASLRISRDIRPFVSISPAAVKRIFSGREQSARLTIAIPADTAPEEYTGSLKLFVRRHWMGLVWPAWKGRQVFPGLDIHLKVRGMDVDLSIKNANHYPTRVAAGPDGKFFVTDAVAGSVFIYNEALRLSGELKGLDSPLGIAVGPEGRIFVGNNGRDNVEVYRADGVLQAAIDDGNITMPNDIVLGPDQKIYVVDSRSHTVKVYDTKGRWLKNIGGPGDGAGQLQFPVAAALSGGEGAGRLYVADQGHARIQVYDLAGNFVQSYGGKIEAFSSEWEGRFSKLQSLGMDRRNRLHALDCYLNKVQILDSETGRYLDSYGGFGTAPGQLNLPLDMLIVNSGQSLVTNAENRRLELLQFVP